MKKHEALGGGGGENGEWGIENREWGIGRSVQQDKRKKKKERKKEGKRKDWGGDWLRVERRHLGRRGRISIGIIFTLSFWFGGERGWWCGGVR